MAPSQSLNRPDPKHYDLQTGDTVDIVKSENAEGKRVLLGTTGLPVAPNGSRCLVTRDRAKYISIDVEVLAKVKLVRYSDGSSEKITGPCTLLVAEGHGGFRYLGGKD